MTIDPKDEKIQEGELSDEQTERVAGGITQPDADNSNLHYNDSRDMQAPRE